MHKKSRTRMHHIWRQMKYRCNNEKCDAYKYYGAKGVTVCSEWESDFQTFYDWSIANGYNDYLTLDRIDGNGNYEPSNCRWVTMKVQCNNIKSNHRITFNGCTKTVTEWAEVYGIKRNTITRRLIRGWDIERAITTPVER